MTHSYSLNLGEEVKKGMTEKAIRGELQTPAPFGYEMSEGVLVPKSGEAEMIALIFNLFLYEQMTGKEIAEIINSKGCLTKKGNKFQKRSIDYIIRNPIYCGKTRWNPKSKSDYSRNASENSIITLGKHEAIIDEETWLAANEKVRDIAVRKRKALESASFLNDKLKCGSCGGRMYLCGKRRSVFRCGNYLNGKCGFSQGISASKIEKVVENELLNDFGMCKIMIKNVEMRVCEVFSVEEHSEVKYSLINHLLFSARLHKDADLLELFYFQGDRSD